MDILNAAKDLAREIQKSESYINLKIASQNNRQGIVETLYPDLP